MQGLFKDEKGEVQERAETSPASLWSTRILGFIGSAIICWIVLRILTPFVTDSGRFTWLAKSWVKIGITSIVALAMAAWLSRIEGTIWGKYYVIVGYLLSLGLIVWIVLRLLHYV